jgi:spoIIIJ-associated protein
VSETLETESPQSEGSPAEAGDATATAVEHSPDASREERGGEDLLVREGDIAGDYLERLLDILDFDGDIDLDVEAGRAIVSVDGGTDLEKLVGQRGDVLEALQELTRLAVQQSTGSRNRLMLDIAGWRSQRRSELTELGRQAAQEVKESGESQRLRPMTPFERKIVHDAVAGVGGVHSESEGEEPRRRVVVLPGG